jgi:protein arginine N-methyltransferase 1
VNTVPSRSALVWDNVYGFDYSCIKDIALREPLVDTVELKAVVTDPCVLKVCFSPSSISFPFAMNAGSSVLMIVQRIDLRTAQKEDLTFTAPFELRATRNDCTSTLSTPREGL